MKRQLIQFLTVLFFSGCLSPYTYSAETQVTIMVLDFELKDLTIYEDNSEEVERAARFKPMLEKALIEIGPFKAISFNSDDQRKADHGKGYLYDHHDIVAELGQANNAQWVIVGRVHKPSYLFSYLKTQLINVDKGTLAADLAVELKGQQDKFLEKGVKRLAVQIREAIDYYNQ